jgi:ubiquinone/menaquinone biosynthesis C-methylase UbiE
MEHSDRFVNDFDEKAKNWDADPERAKRARAVAEAVRKHVPLNPGMTAFEYGCGTGLLGFALHPYLSHVTMADSSPGMLAVLRKKIEAGGVTNMAPVRLDLETDPPPGERVDLIFTMMALHHVRDVPKILKNFYALLAEPGTLCVADMDREDGSFHGPDFTGHRGFDRTELAELAEKTGFERIRFDTVYQISKKTDGNKKTYSMFLMIAEKERLG